MKISFLSLIILLGCSLFNSVNVMALHHEPQNAQESKEKMPDNEGIVVNTMDAAGYTYMELENSGHKFWIAAPTTKVSKGDHIRYSGSMIMSNFTSKTLNRTFSTIVFVTSTQIKK
ncbi:hypothetical protein [Nitrosomonas ureae]|uniref:NrfJ n=1 Tax=Nitrosomonas ureae TaxID=44577 RepID=A0A2T5IIR8_9PROT|nr:hypothetical protein [Nitrosomonas ureae]PTQ83723.1 hypothetical protein C8R28_102249 [Nitrosomonas ureae]PXX15062.1 hypothetical protein C8R27_11253 [Nitrosomonas ureae]